MLKQLHQMALKVLNLNPFHSLTNHIRVAGTFEKRATKITHLILNTTRS